ncbi:hypothetical protein BYT27DRAFT_7341129 [Phlegmacium glaucopus]|nr:hypothetical protein BYT27DRAFT_7341129 [Phlegmacium glaucopus]
MATIPAFLISDDRNPLHATCESSFYPRETDSNNFTQRSEWNIVWSYFATLFACSWISVHPNIPAPPDSSTRVFVRRLMIMGYRGWTTTHGFFASMGGFILHEDGVMTENLEIEKLETLVAEGKIDWPTISEKDIQDRTGAKETLSPKALPFSKLLGSLLELTTLAFSVLNAILYFLWWNKPLGVSCPVAIHPRPPTTSKTALPSSDREARVPAMDSEYRETRDQDISSLYSYSSYLSTLRPVYEMPTTDLQPRDQDISSLYSDFSYLSILDTACEMSTTYLQFRETRDQDISLTSDYPPIFTPFQHNPSAFARFRAYIRKIFQHNLSAFTRFRTYPCEKVEVKRLFTLIVKKPFQVMLAPIISMSFDVMGNRHRDPLSIPPFYAPPTSRESHARLIGIGIGILFGEIHCIAWSFRFQSVAEQYIWKISAVNITVLPIIITIIFAVIFRYGIHHSLIPYMVVYWLSHAVLLVLPLLALRSLPAEALLDLKWTAFIPHI